MKKYEDETRSAFSRYTSIYINVQFVCLFGPYYSLKVRLIFKLPSY
jgi:hypothetical protein